MREQEQHTDERDEPRECGWLGCGHPRCAKLCTGVPLTERRAWRDDFDYTTADVRKREPDGLAPAVPWPMRLSIWAHRKRHGHHSRLRRVSVPSFDVGARGWLATCDQCERTWAA